MPTALHDYPITRMETLRQLMMPIQRSMSFKLATTNKSTKKMRPAYSAFIKKFSEGFLRVIIS